MKQGIVNCMKFRQGLTKYNVSVVYSYVEAGFQVCPCGGKLNMSEEMLSCMRQKFKELIANGYSTFQKKRGAKHGAQLWQKHHFEAKESMRKITQKGKYTSILDRFQNEEVFHASQRQHNWTEEWCKYLDCVRTIDITHRSSPEHRERYAALYHFRYHPKSMERGPMKSRPDYHETTRALVSMNREAGQNPQVGSRRKKCRDDLDAEKLKWLMWLSQNWKRYFAVNRHSENMDSTQSHHQELMEKPATGNRASSSEEWASPSNNWWNASWWGRWFLVGEFKMDLD